MISILEELTRIKSNRVYSTIEIIERLVIIYKPIKKM